MIVGLSLGEEREIVMESRDGKQKVKHALPPGSLFVMDGDTNNYWKHSIRKQPAKKNARISITFRGYDNIENQIYYITILVIFCYVILNNMMI